MGSTLAPCGTPLAVTQTPETTPKEPHLLLKVFEESTQPRQELRLGSAGEEEAIQSVRVCDVPDRTS